MTAITRITLGLAVWTSLFMGGCAGRDENAATTPGPEIKVACIGVLPVYPVIDADETLSQAEIKNLNEGSQAMNGLLKEALGGKSGIRFVSTQQMNALTGTSGKFSGLDGARQLGHQVGCNVLLETNLSRYDDRVGGQYGVKESAAVTFDYKLYEVGEGRVLCHGRFDEKQQSVMENLLNLNKASSRGFSWVTAEELMREGLKDRLNQCSYFSDK